MIPRSVLSLALRSSLWRASLLRVPHTPLPAPAVARPAPASPLRIRNASSAAAAASLEQPALELGFEEDARVITLVRRMVVEWDRLLAEAAEEAEMSDSSVARGRRLKELEPLCEAWAAYESQKEALESTLSIAHSDPDPSMRSLAADDLPHLLSTLPPLYSALAPQLLALSPTSSLSSPPAGALLELKAGVGGAESALFVGDMMRMYVKYAGRRGWSAKEMGLVEAGAGGAGWKEALLEVKGEGAWEELRGERGVHRVQRVPATETAGRVHTSTIGVLVMPLLDNTGSSGPTEKLYDDKDVKVEVMRARGAGGQHVNRTESAVRLTHTPTGIQVSMQDERSQHTNRRKAYEVLSARLLERKLTAEQEVRRASRRSQVKGMDRSDKVRTYNFPQDRITDHRISLTLSDLPTFFEGDGLGSIVAELREADERVRLEGMLDELEEAEGAA